MAHSFNDFQVTKDDIEALIDMLADVKRKWEAIFIQCKVPFRVLQDIKNNPMNLMNDYHFNCCSAALSHWTSEGNDNAKFSVLISALRSRNVGEGALANTIIKNRLKLPSSGGIKNQKENNKTVNKSEAKTVNKSEAKADPDDGLRRGNDEVKDGGRELGATEEPVTEEAGMSLTLDEVKKIPSIVTLLGLEEDHKKEITGQGIKLAVIDKDFSRHEAIKHFQCYEVNDEGECEDLGKGNFIKYEACSHGTKVAGVAAGKTVPRSYYFNVKTEENEICKVPLVGVAPDAEATIFLADYKKKDNNKEVNCVLDEIIKIGKDPENRFDVLSMSFQIPESDETAHKIAEIYTMGTVIVAAAGNDGDTKYTSFPARLSEVISVGSLGDYSKLAAYTSSNYPPSVYIHGKCLVPLSFKFSPKQAADYSTFGPDHGTSIATAALAGLICLIASVAPNKNDVLKKHKLLKLFNHIDTRTHESVVTIRNACNFLLTCKDAPGYLKRCIQSP